MPFVPRQSLAGGQDTLSSVPGSGTPGEVWPAQDHDSRSKVGITLPGAGAAAAAKTPAQQPGS